MKFLSENSAPDYKKYPPLRFMGSKLRLLPWIDSVLSEIPFESATDPFSGSGCVSYMLKRRGKRVVSGDFLNFAYHYANALTANSGEQLTEAEIAELLRPNAKRRRFIEDTFDGLFFPRDDLRFLDNTWANLRKIEGPLLRSLVIAALCRSCVKKQPRGVFTVSCLDGRHDDGRRDIRLSLKDHFLESLTLFSGLVFDNGRKCESYCADVFSAPENDCDLAYLDPPYVPRADDNCYIKRYHFLEGLSCYWEGLDIMESSRVRKIKKRYTPFSYRRDAVAAFSALFDRFREKTIVLSYSSNGYPDLEILVSLLEKYKSTVNVHERDHRYHFGTHSRVRDGRVLVKEYLLIGTDF